MLSNTFGRVTNIRLGPLPRGFAVAAGKYEHGRNYHKSGKKGYACVEKLNLFYGRFKFTSFFMYEP